MCKLLLPLLLYLLLPTLSAAELLQFGDAEFRLEGRKIPGLDQVKIERAPLSGSRRNGTAVRWGDPVPVAMELGLVSPASPEIGRFEQATFSLRVEFPEPVELRRIVLRLRDSRGELFQFVNNVSGTFSGKRQLDYRVAEGAAAAVWGGDRNRKIDWPLRFHGIAVDCSARTRSGAVILLDSLACRRSGEAATISLETGHRLNLLLPQRQEPPALIVRNEGSGELFLGGVLRIEDGAGNLRQAGVSARATPETPGRIALPGDYSAPGWWKLNYRLISATGKEYSGEHRFGRMVPAGPVAKRTPGFLLGVCSHMERFGREKAELEALAAGLCGAGIMRLDFSWNRFQPEPDRWNFTLYDQLVGLLAAQGVEVEAILGNPPDWAVPRDFTPKYRAPEFARVGRFADPALYAAFCAKIAEHYQGRIRYFELWNEPDLILFANFDFSRYMELLRAGYDAIRRVSPQAVVMNGGIAGTQTDAAADPRSNNGWIRLLKEDGGRHFDLFAFHGHGPLAGYQSQLEQLERSGLIGRNAHRPWYSNETAESSVRIGEREQAASLFRKLLTARAFGAVGYNWYNLREKGELYAPGHYERHFGLLTTEFEPKPAYLAFNMLSANYRNAEFTDRIPVGKEISALRFRGTDGGALLALWSNQRERPRTLFATLPPGTVKVDLFGKETPVELRGEHACIPVTSTPFTLKTPPGGSGEIRLTRGFLPEQLPVQLILEPGRERTCSIALFNPAEKPLSLTLNAAAPDGVSVTPEREIVPLRPGETREVRLVLRAAKSFTAPLSHPETLQLELSLDDAVIERIPLALTRKPAAGEPLFVLADAGQYHALVPSAPGNEPFYWQGPADLSARIFLERRGEFLRLKAEVTDDRHAQTNSGEAIWRGDSVQFGLALPGQKGFWSIGFARRGDGGTEVFCWSRPEGFADPSAAVRATARRDEKNRRTLYEALLPFAALGMTREIAGTGFRFNLIVNDNDGKLREGYLAAAPGMGTGEDPSLWKVLQLE